MKNIYIIIETSPFKGEFDRYPEVTQKCFRQKIFGTRFYTNEELAEPDLAYVSEVFPDLEFKIAQLNSGDFELVNGIEDPLWLL